jgi:hypothetical protein
MTPFYGLTSTPPFVNGAGGRQEEGTDMEPARHRPWTDRRPIP